VNQKVAHSLRILLLDDDAAGTRALTTLLGMDGFEVVALADARAALERMKCERFDAVIADLELAGGLLAHLQGTPVYLITDGGERPLVRGAKRVFGKPVPYDALYGELTQR
jgi:CheY-like chemotaxis protein